MKICCRFYSECSLVDLSCPNPAPQELPTEASARGLQSSPLPSLSTPTASWSPAAARLRTPPCSQAAVSIRPVQSPFPVNIKRKVPFVTHPKPGATLPRLLKFHWSENYAEEGQINPLLGQSQEEVSAAGIKIKNDENEKKKIVLKLEEKAITSYSNENARRHLFCSFIHQTCINSAGIWAGSYSPTGQTDCQTLKTPPSCQIHVSVNGKSQAALTSAWALPEVTGWGWEWEWGSGGVGKNWVFSASVDRG